MSGVDAMLIEASEKGQTNQVLALLQAGADVHAQGDLALRRASRLGHTETVRVLLQAGADVHARDDEALRKASDAGHAEVVRLLLQAGANVHAKDDEAIIFAYSKGHEDVALLLNEAGAIFDDDDLEKALIEAAKIGDSQDVALLLQAGANVHTEDDEALYSASANGHTEVVRLLLKAGADVHAEDDYALRWASYFGHLAVVELLVKAGADVHAADDEALRAASRAGHLSVVQFLVTAGANVHANNDYALRRASENGHLPVVELLVKAGADVHAADDYALRAASRAGHLSVVQFLVTAGANVHADDDGALRAASSRGHLSVVEFLVKAGSNVHAADDEALRAASEYGHLPVVQFLVTAGANVHANNDQALLWASSFGHLAVVEFLVTAGADVHAKDDSALRMASKYGHLAVVQFLVKAGADVHAKDDQALRWASDGGHTAVVAFLKATQAAVPVPATPTPDVVFPLLGRPVAGFPATPTVCVAEATRLGGTTGATLVRCGTSLYVRKSVPSAVGVVLYNEYLANRIYDLLGVPVPPCRFYATATECVLLSAYLTPTEALWGSPPAVVQAFRKNFAVDALLANWDVLGQTMDNVLVYAGVPYRIDVGGALYRRAQGSLKTAEDFSFQVVELYTMRCMSGLFKSPHCEVFASLTDAEVAEQIQRVAPRVRAEVLPLVDYLPVLHSVLQGRIAMMEQWATTHSRALTQVRTPVAGTESKVTKDGYAVTFKVQIDYLARLRQKDKNSYEAVRMYVESNYYSEFNKQLCSGSLTTKARELSNDLTTAFLGLPPLPMDILVYRGLPTKIDPVRLGCQYVSTSTNKSSSVAFMQGSTCCLMVITLPAGVRAFPVRTVGNTMAHEYEVLLPPGGQWVQRGGSYVENGITTYNYDYIPSGPKFVYAPVAAGMYVVHNGMLLVHKRSARLGGFLSCPGGSITPPETPKAAAAREAMEEAGVRVSDPNEFFQSYDGKFVAYAEYAATRPTVMGPNAYSLSELDMTYDWSDVPGAEVVPGTGHAWVPLKDLYTFITQGTIPLAQQNFVFAVLTLLSAMA